MRKLLHGCAGHSSLSHSYCTPVYGSILGCRTCRILRKGTGGSVKTAPRLGEIRLHLFQPIFLALELLNPSQPLALAAWTVRLSSRGERDNGVLGRRGEPSCGTSLDKKDRETPRFRRVLNGV